MRSLKRIRNKIRHVLVRLRLIDTWVEPEYTNEQVMAAEEKSSFDAYCVVIACVACAYGCCSVGLGSVWNLLVALCR